MCTADDLFDCPRHTGGLRLLPTACAGHWLKARGGIDPADPWRSCRGCEIGARHAGHKPEQAIPEKIAHVCPRCLRSANKIVRGLCMSCYNRQREFERNRDARGYVPRGTRPREIAVQAIGTAGVQICIRAATSPTEAILLVLKASPDLRAFGRAPRPVGPQLCLWGCAC